MANGHWLSSLKELLGEVTLPPDRRCSSYQTTDLTDPLERVMHF